LKHQPTNVIIKGLHNIVCPGYPNYTSYDKETHPPVDNWNIKNANDPSNYVENIKSFSIGQWLFDFFTENMVWERPTGSKTQNANASNGEQIPDDLAMSQQLQLRHNLERSYLSKKVEADFKPQLVTVACDSKLTLSTQVVFSFDANTGVSQEISPVYVLPISLLTIDINPSWTQTLQIQFALANTQNNDLCMKMLQIKPLGSS
jgi:hypothetical protein